MPWISHDIISEVKADLILLRLKFNQHSLTVLWKLSLLQKCAEFFVTLINVLLTDIIYLMHGLCVTIVQYYPDIY